MCRNKKCPIVACHDYLFGYCCDCYNGRSPHDLRKGILAETIEKYKSKLSKEELIELLKTGHTIYQQGVGLIFEEALDMINERYK